MSAPSDSWMAIAAYKFEDGRCKFIANLPPPVPYSEEPAPGRNTGLEPCHGDHIRTQPVLAAAAALGVVGFAVEATAYEPLVRTFKQVDYARLMGSRPQTLYGIADSPIGLSP